MQRQTKRKIGQTAFLQEFIRGASEGEMLERFDLTHSQWTRVVGKLKERGLISEDVSQERSRNLKIRFGSEIGPENGDKSAVDYSSGLVLHCSSCGAAVKRGAHSCDYCSAPLDFELKGKRINCPKCLAETPAHGRFCIRCAEPVAGRIKKGLKLEDRLCPKCSVPMAGLNIGDFSVMGCEECDGAFVPHNVFEMMQNRADSLIYPTQPTQRSFVVPKQPVKYVRCPVCRAMMNRKNFGEISGIIVDICKSHGIWFNAGEIAAIMDFIIHGGLKTAQNVTEQREKDEERLRKIRSIPIGELPERTMLGRPSGSGFAEATNLFDLIWKIIR